MEGFLLIDKPGGMTSHDVVNRVRRLTGEKRVGHAGTLDPFATGLLVVGVGRVATREMEKLVGLDKTYEAEFVLGAHSDTDDRTGTITPDLSPSAETNAINPAQIIETLKQFIGTIQQTPPAYSAIKIGGKKMYEAARAGKPLEAKSRTVTIYSIEPHPSQPLKLTIHCSTGTYIRAIARDLGLALGTGGYVQELRRTSIGPFVIGESTPLDSLQKETVERALIPVPNFLLRL